MEENKIMDELKKMYVDESMERGVGALVHISVEELHPHPDNPRKELGDLTELVESIKAKGVMQNLTVVPRLEGGYTVIIGHRRSAAAKEAGLATVPCVIVEMSEREQVATMLLENMQRVDLTAYEQAQGFQMMIDFGESVESISEKTGFSKKTVRGRLKMAELDSDILREVSSSRQLSIGDFDKIAQIEDIGKRNALLRDVGTNNFEQSFSRALKQQKIDHAMPFVRDALKALKGKKIERSETYGGKYHKILEVKLENIKSDSVIEIPKKHEAEKLFYYIDEYWGDLNIYILTPKAAPIKRSKEEIEREKQIKDAHATLDALASEAYELRFNFIKGLKVTNANVEAVKEGAFLALLVEQYVYSSYAEKRNVYAEAGGIEGIENLCLASELFDKIIAAYRTERRRIYPSIIYASFGDTKGEGFHKGLKNEYPQHRENRRLSCLYEWLVSLGYEMSDDERGLMDGTHPVFERGEPGKEADDGNV